jgi:hypothetical protein
MRTDAKDLAFAQVAGYYRLGHDCAENVKVLLQNQAYVYPQDFDVSSSLIPTLIHLTRIFQGKGCAKTHP